ncbi:MbnP family protein [Flavobacterium myungsuense]|uniref:MbnP family protein n=1 Tax=Flavobacterium myungsuense TaxID=651823 RepID=A0ABW3J1Q8_9FLAO
MKFQLKHTIAILAIAFLFTSCSNDDNNEETISGNGAITLEFDNVFKTANFAFNTNYTNSNGEVLNVTKLKYIVSNIVLTKEDGSTFIVPKSESYFIVDESIEESQDITLLNIPAGNYKSVQFGIGVDRAQWELGADGQGDFLAKAQTAGMMWAWTGGYKFVNFEGTFTTPTNTTPTNFKVHTGKTMVSGVENYNYATVTLNFPENEKALVRTSITPEVHLFVDVSKILDGNTVINLADAIGGNIMGGAKLATITENLNAMISVNHIHND